MQQSLLITTAILLALGGTAYAADTAPAPRPSTAATQPTTPATTSTTASADAKKLIGRNIQNTQNETIGEVKSVRIGADGKVQAVIVGVGGFLGMGEREVALDWSQLNVANNGEKVTVAMTKDQLKALPEYKYADATHRGTVFTDSTGVRRTADTTPPRDVTTNRPAAAPAAAPTANRTAARTGDFNARGEISGNALIGATVKNTANETVGKVEDVFVEPNGAIKSLIVSVGGMLGLAGKDVVMGWQDLKVSRDQDKLVLLTSATKDTLKTLPEYKK